MFLGTIGVLVAAVYVFRVIAPLGDAEAMGALVAWVWMFHMVEIFRGRRTLASGVAAGFVFCALTTALIAAGMYLSRA